ncbi:hypothetical protein MCOL2_09356 [Listeria fleischmannii FSL S10-1203]|uniref:F-type ATPase subunit delta n=1 Tax=Listeria fleischmannii FSL S10-1203 TaxID=1265822 RepID=W7DM08_9LIST|nr:hypothetical protein MCOL2_09356 [Listeria fleischmannii FSL S10-1203]
MSKDLEVASRYATAIFQVAEEKKILFRNLKMNFPL